MLTMEQIECIKELQTQGASTAEIEKKLSIDWKTAKKYVQEEDFSPKPPLKQERGSLLEPWKSLIQKWLTEDQKNRYKQRHTAQRIYDRLRVEHPEFTGSYSMVQRYVKQVRVDRQPKTFLELVWPPGEAQADFGEADFDTPTGLHGYYETGQKPPG